MLRPGSDGRPEKQQHHVDEIHVGDIMFLEGGLVVPVDGVLIQSNELMISEAAMTGESDALKKEKLEIC